MAWWKVFLFLAGKQLSDEVLAIDVAQGTDAPASELDGHTVALEIAKA